jgi:diguanylate cyclase (GGDEF)-like protein/putative nucleotidyltransferase with HDIG domain
LLLISGVRGRPFKTGRRHADTCGVVVAEPDAPPRRAILAGLPIAARTLAVVAVLLALTTAATVTARRIAAGEIADVRARQATAVTSALDERVVADEAAVRGLVGLFATSREIDAFSQYAEPALADRALLALGFAPHVTAAMRSSFERANGFEIAELSGTTRRRAGARTNLFPVLYVAPVAISARAVGLDIASAPAVAAAVDAALAAGAVQVTRPLALLGGEPGLVIVAPAFRRGAPLGSPAQRAGALTGFAIGFVRLGSLAHEVLAPFPQLAVRVRDGGDTVLVRGRPSVKAAVRTVSAGGRPWRVEVDGPAPATDAVLPWLVFAAGLLVTALVAAMVEQNARRLVFAEDRVARRTVELRTALAELAETNSALEAARAEAALRSQVDALTGAYNRGHFIDLVRVELNRAARGDSTPAVLLVAVDDFRQLNEDVGASVGDVVLVEVAHRLGSILRSYDSLARYADRQFAVLAPNVPDDAALYRVCEAVRSVVEAGPICVDGAEVWATVSVGAARATDPGNAFAVLGAADRALDAARRRGRNVSALAGDGSEGDVVRGEPDAVRIAQALAESAARREGMPPHHCGEVADLAARIAEELGLDADAVLRARLGGWLHDVGKVALPADLLAHDGAYTDADWARMRAHSTLGAEIVERMPALAAAAPAIRHHHERYDGGGYPDGLADEAIPIEARIVAAADAYSAMTADPPYRRSRNRVGAIRELRAAAGGQLDPAVVEALCRVLDAVPV